MSDVAGSERLRGLRLLGDDITGCTACPRLVEWRRRAAAHPPASHAGEDYWAKPLPGFGDPGGRLVLVGLAPAAHGGNRTGRMFTGDRSGDFLYAALHRAGFANQAVARTADDGLRLADAYVTAAVRCAPPDNKPSPEERDRCGSFLTRELALLTAARVYLALGAFAYEALWRSLSATGAVGGRRPRFAHGTEIVLDGLGSSRSLLCSYHPSQRNVFTGLLTPEMFDQVLSRAQLLLSSP